MEFHIINIKRRQKMISKNAINKTIKELTKKYPHQKERIKIGVNQVSKLWQSSDGNEKEFFDFCINNFETGERLEKIFERYNEKYEYMKGYLTALYLRLRLELDEDRGELLNIDRYFSTLNPMAHLSDDLFKTKIAFLILLNFPLSDLKHTIKNMDMMTRKDWAINRMTKMFEARVPSEISQKITDVYSKASEYVYSYNIPIKNILYENGEKIFDEDLKLISHWGLRDQIKIYYSQNSTENLKKQKTIYKLMERIINGEVPYNLIKNQSGEYNPYTNSYNSKPNREWHLERYSHLKNIYLAHKEEDKYHILYNNYITRMFNGIREIPFEKVEEMFIDILKDKNAFKIAEIIKIKLGRNLEPFDIWYNQFLTKSDGIDLDEEVRKKYPTIDDFQKSIKDILIKLDFDEKTAEYLSDKIEVDPARGAGHAWGPEMRGKKHT